MTDEQSESRHTVYITSILPVSDNDTLCQANFMYYSVLLLYAFPTRTLCKLAVC